MMGEPSASEPWGWKQGPIALEDPRVRSRRHMHSVVRTPNGNDYGKDLLRIPHLGSGSSASPVAADNKIYLSDEDGDMIVVRAGRESDHIATNSMGSC